jgi:hypothetical protein
MRSVLRLIDATKGEDTGGEETVAFFQPWGKDKVFPFFIACGELPFLGLGIVQILYPIVGLLNKIQALIF